jgi:hypothetical protein
MERFGHDMSSLQPYADQEAADLARVPDALDYTRVPQIEAAEGQKLGEERGQTLLASEMAQVVQVRAGPGPQAAGTAPAELGTYEPTDAASGGSAEPASSRWPFGVPIPPDVRANYLDDRTVALSVRLLLGIAIFTLDSGQQLELPLASFQEASYNIVPVFPAAPDESQARAMVDMKQLRTRGLEPCAFYRDSTGAVMPTLLNEQTLPRVMPTFRQALAVEREAVAATEKTLIDLLLWYIGARFPIKLGRGAGASGEEVAKAATKGGPAAKAAFDAAKIADELFIATKAIANPGERMLVAGRQLSAMGGVTAAQKVEIILEFFRRIGFAISRAGVVDEGARFVMYSEDSRYAFAFLKDTGEILYGKFNMQTMQYVWNILK